MTYSTHFIYGYMESAEKAGYHSTRANRDTIAEIAKGDGEVQ